MLRYCGLRDRFLVRAELSTLSAAPSSKAVVVRASSPRNSYGGYLVAAEAAIHSVTINLYFLKVRLRNYLHI